MLGGTEEVETLLHGISCIDQYTALEIDLSWSFDSQGLPRLCCPFTVALAKQEAQEHDHKKGKGMNKEALA